MHVHPFHLLIGKTPVLLGNSSVFGSFGEEGKRDVSIHEEIITVDLVL
jgi:hypothetical protein